MSTVDSSPPQPLLVSLLGAAKGVVTTAVLYPIEAIKVRQQCSLHSEWVHQTAFRIFSHQGMGGFFQGLSPQLLKTGLKQAWCFPIITSLPPLLESEHLSVLGRQCVTGLIIGTLDALIATPLERAKVLLTLSEKRKSLYQLLLQNGWKNFPIYWAKQSMTWCTFLTSQQYFRDQARMNTDKPLSVSDLILIGLKISVIGSVLLAPLDVMNSIQQGQQHSISLLLKVGKLRSFFKGLPLSFLSASINSMASVILLDRISIWSKKLGFEDSPKESESPKKDFPLVKDRARHA